MAQARAMTRAVAMAVAAAMAEAVAMATWPRYGQTHEDCHSCAMDIAMACCSHENNRSHIYFRLHVATYVSIYVHGCT